MLNDLKTWQAQRTAELSAPESWLGLVGLFWLEEGLNRVGSDEAAVVRLPAGPPHLGDLECVADRVFWRPVGGVSRELDTDRSGRPAAVHHENLSFFVVDRDGRLAARVRDREWAAKQAFASPEYFPFAAEWVIEAVWEPLLEPLTMEVPNVAGELKAVQVAYQSLFTVAGESVALLPMSVGPDEIFFVFRDRSSGKETYGAGRFLKALPAVDGKITLDFNRAYNPPCAFTPFATCPLPPPENWLPFAVPAGEKKWVKPV